MDRSKIADIGDEAIFALKNRQYARSADLFKIFFDRDPSLYNSSVAASLWMTDAYEDACEHWLGEIKRRYTGQVTYFDKSGGVDVPAMLWWASARPSLGARLIPSNG